MGLRINTDAMMNTIYSIVEQELKEALNSWELEVIRGMKHRYYIKNRKIISFIKRRFDGRSKLFVATLKANNFVLADSYGTGSRMLENNPWFAEYKQKYWHSYRTSKTIVGRKKGTYIDIFGNKRTTSGSMRGKSLEGVRVHEGNIDDYYIEATHPSYALQLAENYLYKIYLPRAYTNMRTRIKNLNLSNFIIES